MWQYIYKSSHLLWSDWCNSFTAPLNSNADKRLAEEPPQDNDDELSSIDAYFKALEKKNEVYQRPRQLAGFR